MYENIKIHEVGLRDGLQNESKIVPFDLKVKWASSIIESGIDILQLGSFVNPTKVPQMADTELLFEHFNGQPYNTILSGLILNEKGMERAVKCGVQMYCMGVSASETHSLKNTGMSTEEAAKRVINMAKELQSDGKDVQISVQSAFGCGFEGKIPEDKVLFLVSLYLDNGLTNISLADTAGHAYPEQVSRLFSSIIKMDRNVALTCHFHNTYGLGMANVYQAMSEGAKSVETAFGGLGGCPFTKVAAGNVATEDFVHALQRNYWRKDIANERIIEVSKEADQFFEKNLEGFVYKTGKLNY